MYTCLYTLYTLYTWQSVYSVYLVCILCILGLYTLCHNFLTPDPHSSLDPCPIVTHGFVSSSNSRAPGSNEHGFETREWRMPLRHSFDFVFFLARSLAPAAVATTPKVDFHANRCPHAKSDGTLHLDARRDGFVGAIDCATKRQH